MGKNAVKRRSKKRRQNKRMTLKRVSGSPHHSWPSSPITNPFSETYCPSPVSELSDIRSVNETLLDETQLKKTQKYISARHVELTIGSYIMNATGYPKCSNDHGMSLKTFHKVKHDLSKSLAADKFFQIFVKWQEASKLKTMAESSIVYYNQFV